MDALILNDLESRCTSSPKMLLFESSGRNKYSGLDHIGGLPNAHSCVASTGAVPTIFKRSSNAMVVTGEPSALATRKRKRHEMTTASKTKKRSVVEKQERARVNYSKINVYT